MSSSVKFNSRLYLSIVLIVLVHGLCNTAAGQKKEPEYFEYAMTKVCDSVYLFTTADPFRVVQGNVTVIVNKNDVVVVDAAGSPDAGRLIVEKIKTLTSNPVRYLIITHWHGDHLFGTQAFVKAYPGVEIISSKFTHDYFIDPGITYPATFVTEKGYTESVGRLDKLIKTIEQKKDAGDEQILTNINRKKFRDYPVIREQYKKLQLITPGQFFRGDITLNRASREIRLLMPGFGDTEGDVWVYLPKEKVLITGDAVVKPVPYGYTSEPFQWIQTLQKMRELDFDFMIPGHGKLQPDKKYLTLLIESLETIKSKVSAAVESGMSLEELIEKIDLDEIKNKFSQGDPVWGFYFNLYFSKPVLTNMYEKLKPSEK